jgi:hypothetical protein
MNSIDQKMLQIKSLDNNASLGLSEFTGKWYVIANIEIGGDGVLTGISEHEVIPEYAVDAYFNSLITVDNYHYLVTGSYDERHHWRWNGAAFQLVNSRGVIPT